MRNKQEIEECAGTLMAFNALRLLLPGGEDGESSEEEALLDHEGGSSSEDSGEEEGESDQSRRVTPSARL